MPPKKSAPAKRKANDVPSPNKSSKKPKKEDTADVEEYGIVDRRFYPPEMTNERCQQYNNDEITRPIELLNDALSDTKSAREKVEVKNAVVHWFKADLRTRDNHALHLASEKAKSKNVPSICLYIVSPQDFEAHITSAIRVDFILRTLEVLKEDLAKLDIPLYVETVEKRRNIPDRILELCEEWGANHLFANAEYEVDELRREASMVRKAIEKSIAFDVLPDTCIVAPIELASGTGKQYSVYTPWYRAWMHHIHTNPSLLEAHPTPSTNPSSAKKLLTSLFDSTIPLAPPNKTLTSDEKKRFTALWPAGESSASTRLTKFLSQKATSYKDERNIPSENMTSKLSVHFSAGTISARTAVSSAREANTSKKLDAGKPGLQTWISEIAWRDFYKHVLVNWPYICMNKPFKPEYSHINWSYDLESFEKWKAGKTGYPIVDAAMRQMNRTGYMHNRCRMITASFLAKHLLIDWRMGERYFMTQLIDGDFASNNGGWGFSASCGVDPQPYFRIFSPLRQSERFDPEGIYIKTWVEELEDCDAKSIHEPYTRGAGKAVEKKGYPRPIVEHKEARERALSSYKEGLGRGTA